MVRGRRTTGTRGHVRASLAQASGSTPDGSGRITSPGIPGRHSTGRRYHPSFFQVSAPLALRGPDPAGRTAHIRISYAHTKATAILAWRKRPDRRGRPGRWKSGKSRLQSRAAPCCKGERLLKSSTWSSGRGPCSPPCKLEPRTQSAPVNDSSATNDTPPEPITKRWRASSSRRTTPTR